MTRKKKIMIPIIVILFFAVAAGFFFLRGRVPKSKVLTENTGETMRTEADFPEGLTPIPSSYSRASSQPGTVERLDYDTYESFTYEQKSQVLHKTAYVYLPYGYDESKQYNVFYMMHGGWCNETTIIGTDRSQTAFKTQLDNAIANGDIPPLIMVFPTYNNLSGDDSGDYSLAIKLTNNYHNELVNDLIPAVEGKYSTYAESTDSEGLAASRDHRAFGGMSMGSVTTWRTFEYCLDYFRYFVPSSGALTTDGSYMDRIVKDSGHEWNDFYIIAATGTADFAGSEFQTMIENMVKQDSFIYSDNEETGNITYRLKQGGRHYYTEQNEYIYNALMWLWNH